MGPENGAEGIHDVFELVHSHITLPSFAIVNICLKLIEAIVYLLMLSEELQLLPKSWHSLRKYGEDVLLFCKPCQWLYRIDRPQGMTYQWYDA